MTTFSLRGSDSEGLLIRLRIYITSISRRTPFLRILHRQETCLSSLDGRDWYNFLTPKRTTRAIAVQLTPQTIKRLDQLAERSRMSRHRYMILVLERALKNNLVLREEVAFSDEKD